MARYKYFDKSRGLLMTINLNDHLIPGSFEHTLNYLIDQLDLSAFDAAFYNDWKSAPTYSLAVMLKTIFTVIPGGLSPVGP
jgi:hypothetical protein